MRYVARTTVACLLLAGSGPAQEIDDMSALPRADRRRLHALIERHGPDAVNLQGNLLRFAIAAGSLLEASAGIRGEQRRDARRILTYDVDTGIVFRDSESTAAARIDHLWEQVVDPALALARRFQGSADILELRIAFRHVDFRNRTDLAEKVRAGRDVREVAIFEVSLADVIERARELIDGPTLRSRARIWTEPDVGAASTPAAL